MSSVELKLSRLNRIYHPSEPLQGKIVVNSTSPISHSGVRITINRTANLQVRGGSAGVIESLYGVVKPIPIVKKMIDVTPPGKIAAGTTEIPFSITLRERGDRIMGKFYETFHGADISIQYLATVGIMRGYLHKSLHATAEFIIETDKAELYDPPLSPEMVIFYITQDTQKHPLLPDLRAGGFRVTGKIATQCSLSDPLSGELIVEKSAVPIESIDIHLLRVESILSGERIVTETSLIQTTQIADGDVCRDWTLPIYVILPCLMTCPTVLAEEGIEMASRLSNSIAVAMWNDYMLDFSSIPEAMWNGMTIYGISSLQDLCLEYIYVPNEAPAAPSHNISSASSELKMLGKSRHSFFR